MNTSLAEIFSSRQGEGPYMGEYMTFVRFGHCALRCKWCDTPDHLEHQPKYRIETPARSEDFAFYENPISAEKLNQHLEGFQDEFLSITGGEPLEQAAFLKAWLPSQAHKKRLLETSGILTKALLSIIDDLDIISMDFKLPSSTGMKAYWKEHEAFLEACLEHQKEVYTKLVVSEETTQEDFETSCKIIKQTQKDFPVIIQPVSKTPNFDHVISEKKLVFFEELARKDLKDVRKIPQMHKTWNVL